MLPPFPFKHFKREKKKMFLLKTAFSYCQYKEKCNGWMNFYSLSYLIFFNIRKMPFIYCCILINFSYIWLPSCNDNIDFRIYVVYRRCLVLQAHLHIQSMYVILESIEKLFIQFNVFTYFRCGSIFWFYLNYIFVSCVQIV